MDYKTPLIFFSPIAISFLYILVKNISKWGSRFQRHFTKQSQAYWGEESIVTKQWSSRFGYILSCAIVWFFGFTVMLLIYSWVFIPFFNPKTEYGKLWESFASQAQAMGLPILKKEIVDLVATADGGNTYMATKIEAYLYVYVNRAVSDKEFAEKLRTDLLGKYGSCWGIPDGQCKE